MVLHPRFGTLSDFADGELDPHRREKVARHLLRCPRCCGHVSFLRGLCEAARAVGDPEPPQGALETILARRAAGDGVILPVANPAPPVRAAPRRRLLTIGTDAAAAVATVAAVAVIFFAFPREAPGGRAELRFDPGEPRAGATLDVEYRPAMGLGGFAALDLRARLRTANADGYNRGPMQSMVAELRRARDGVFRGRFTLPDSVVYAVFAVEDPESGRIDHNAGRLWELLVHGPDGRPLFEALEQKKNDLLGRSWEAAYETVRRTTELYPERADAWMGLGIFEGFVLNEKAADSLRTEHERRYRRFHAALSTLDRVPAHQAYGMAGYYFTAGAGDESFLRYWRDRLEREHPDHPEVLFGRENRLAREHAEAPDAYLRAVEPLWQRVVGQIDGKHVREAFINNALNRAARAADPKWFLLWMERSARLGRRTAEGVAYRVRQILERHDLREEALAMLRAELRHVAADPPAYRPLSRTATEQERENREDEALLLVTLADGLLEAADTAAALDTLALAVDRAWSPDALRKLGDVRLAVGDTAGALESYAAVAADPGTSPAFTDSVATRTGIGFASERWLGLHARARDRMSRQLLATAHPRPLPGPVRLRGPHGESRSLAELAAGRPTTVLFWSHECPPAVQALPEIRRAAAWTESHGGRFLLVVEKEPDEDVESLLEKKGLKLLAYHDFRREAARAFESFGTPRHYVLDAAGNLVFAGEGSEITRIPRQMAALLRR
ncbi:MAG: redoxin domain-containing protein [Gemmatimonadota bacterium]